jgi:signal transduction histidine kinase/DNA-binding response OmpR family regulator
MAPASSAGPAPARYSRLRNRLRASAWIGLAVVGAWLYYTVDSVGNLYNVTVALERLTDLRERTQEANVGLSNSEEALGRYTVGGEAYDRSRYTSGRVALHTALGAIQRRGDIASARGLLERAQAAEDFYGRMGDQAAAAWSPQDPAESRNVYDTMVKPAADKLQESLSALQGQFIRSEAIASERLKDSRNSAAAAVILLAALIAAGVLWLLFDINRRILEPFAFATAALKDLAEGRAPPRLAEGTSDEVGELGRAFNRVADLSEERSRALEERDVEKSVSAVLAVAATVNDLKGFRSKVLEKIVEVTGASTAVLYLPEPDGSFAPAVAIGGGHDADERAGRDQAARAARERQSIFLSVDPRTPTVDVFDGRILPRQSAHIPLIYFDQVVGVLALGATESFTHNAQNSLAEIASSLAVALANASANERVAEQSRRLAEQNELLEEQRSRIARTARELQRASELKDRFLASVSHELRTPMTVILGFTAALLRGAQGALNGEQRDSLERVQRNAQQLLGLINDVLDISKIESGKMEISAETVSVAALLRQVQADFQDAARRKGLDLVCEVEPELTTVTTDPARVTQILTNLVGNALKFTERGSIRVRAAPRGRDSWEMTVSDTGIGIPKSEQPAIFEEFRQGESVEHRGRGGTGLGLAIVRRLASVLGGSVSLESEPGHGSRFTVVLPRQVAIARPAAPAPPQRPSGRTATTVLVVDDDEAVRRLLKVELEARGISTIEAASGREALERARSEKPGAILLDVLMPQTDGWETLRELKAMPETRSIPVVVLSVVEDRAFGFALGAFDYLVKPLSRSALFEVLSRAGVIASRGYVLIVDDQPDLRSLLEKELVAAGYRARSVPGGAEALEQIDRDPPSAVLLDLMMPPPDGFEVLYRLRQNPRFGDLPVIVVTARDLSPQDYDQLNAWAQRIVRKSGDPRDVVAQVLSTLAQPGALAPA